MKLTIFALLLTFSSSPAFSKNIDIKINGMVCSLCGQGIQKKFSKVKEVKSISVDMDNKSVILTMKESLDISDEEINKIITEAGYNVQSIQRK